MTLFDEIRQEVMTQLSGSLVGLEGGKRRLVFFIGNSLTRIAATATNAPQISWADWIDKSWAHLVSADASHQVPSLPFLRNKGFSNDQIFSILADRGRAVAHKFLGELYSRLKDVRPSVLHRLILLCSHSVITTNYDNLFEQSSLEYRLPWGRLDPLGQDDWKPSSRRLIHKIHGTFPLVPTIAYPGVHDAQKLALFTETYQRVGQEDKEPAFRARYRKVLKLLTDPQNLVVFLGSAWAVRNSLCFACCLRLVQIERSTIGSASRCANHWITSTIFQVVLERYVYPWGCVRVPALGGWRLLPWLIL